MYRSQSRSRSGSPHRSSTRATRFRRRSISRSSRFHKRRSSRSRSHSRGNHPSLRPTDEPDTKGTVSLLSAKVEDSSPKQLVVKQEEQDATISASHELSNHEKTASPSPTLSLVVKAEPTEVRLSPVGEVKSEPALQTMKWGDTVTDAASPLPPMSPKEHPTSVTDEVPGKVSSVAGPQTLRAPRSPPRGPRSYHHLFRSTGAHSQSHLSAHRAVKRRASNIFISNGKYCLSLHNGEKVELPERPKYDPITDMEKTVSFIFGSIVTLVLIFDFSLP